MKSFFILIAIYKKQQPITKYTGKRIQHVDMFEATLPSHLTMLGQTAESTRVTAWVLVDVELTA
jgi:hypothetical protein